MSLRAKLTIGTATAASLLLLAGTASAATPGAPGIGDPYYPNAGNGGYDVSHYDVRLNYRPSDDNLSGTTTITAKATQDLTGFNLDFVLNVSSVRVNNRVASFKTEKGELVVDPKATLRKGADLTIVVTYSDAPSKRSVDGYTAWRRTADGALAIDEPDAAPWWYPSNNHPTDKATFDVSVSVPDGLEVVSNGTFAGTVKQINGWTRWRWRSVKPQATYLTFVAIGQFEVRHQVAPNGQPFVTAYSLSSDSADDEAAKASVERTPEIVEFLEGSFGPYPFEAQGGVVTPGINFALENQTRSTYGTAFFRRGANTYVVAHENAHQWWGDSVSVHAWRNIWLNEGFASYAEFLWSEYIGEGTAQENAQFTYDLYPADSPFWQVLPGDPGADKQFDGAVYDRGALAVHALRVAVGDQHFFEILKTWLAKKKYGDATIEEFVAHAEKISGKPLVELFQTWLFTKGKPAAAPGGQVGIAAKSVAKPKSFDQIRETHRILSQS
ncbi:M1 family metallopeptidase [Saccharothrix violaceirubra]|uniref:Aminopeptidase N n=1 Tax=Saccharothrix violaceirubra TaxID=413306 RepID=A0A7W7SXK2_9PSEU|nr:M1 family metallopeptidase [Saccharothrix violaceirubra]MBB4962799.1 aminopeptidase N [Saccharothrix violaceirubra]